MLNRLVLLFPSCIGGESGTSLRSTSCDRRDNGTAYSLLERPLESAGGGARAAVAVAGRRGPSSSSLSACFPLALLSAAAVGVSRSSTLRRLSIGMAGMRSYGVPGGHWGA